MNRCCPALARKKHPPRPLRRCLQNKPSAAMTSTVRVPDTEQVAEPDDRQRAVAEEICDVLAAHGLDDFVAAYITMLRLIGRGRFRGRARLAKRADQVGR